ncbi:disease resistance protein RUN1 [Cryptomeria japonica]|uniref:disease resistance protein RUN1 n=1 Tax=Cryptomeria japonica TaxID=3369 RepID=UPI0027D9F05A|nr:disease resistance protein RUN1 [Cryptomeria japonica]
MEDVFPSYDVLINHRGPDTKKTLASLIYRELSEHGLRVFLDERELEVGDPFPPAIQSAIRGASVHIAIFSKTYAESVWCLDELLWMFDSHGNIIPIFYDIQPWELRHVGKGAYAGAFQDHRDKGRITIEQVDRWITALNKVADISGVVFETEKDNHGDRLKQIVDKVLEKVGKKQLYVCDHPVGLLQAAANLEKQVLSPSGTNVVGIVGLSGSGKSILATHLYNSKCSQFQRCCFLSDVSKRDLPSLQQTLLRDLLRDRNLCIEDTGRGRTLLRDRLRGLIVLIVFEDIDNREQIDNLLFVKNHVGDGSLILVTSKDRTLLQGTPGNPRVEIYDVELLGAKDAQELFCWRAFGHTEPVQDLQNMVEELVRMCGGFPLALIVLGELFVNERRPRMWKKRLDSLSKGLPDEVLSQIVMDSYKSLNGREKEAFLDVAHFLMGEDRDLVERVLDGLLNDDGFQCLETLHRKCLVELKSADIIRQRELGDDSVDWSGGIWRRAKGSSKIRMHDLVRDLARQIGRQELPLRLCCSSDKMISTRVSTSKYDVRGIRGDEEHELPVYLQNQDINGLKILAVQNSSSLQQFNTDRQISIYVSTSKYNVFTQQYGVRGIRGDEEHELPVYLQNQDINGLKILAVQNSSSLQQFNSVSGDLIWLRLSCIPSTLLLRSLRNIPSTLLLRSLRVLELHGVSPQDFCNLFDDREPPSELRALEVAFNRDFGSASTSTAGPSTAVFKKHGSTSESLPPPTAIPGLKTFHAWLGKLNLRNLVKIVLQNIRGLKTLPIKFEEVTNLTHVDLSGCSDLEVLPNSFTEELLQLQYLALRDCRNLVLQDLGKISKLEYLDFQGCSMLKEMPKGTEVQKSLMHLNVVHTELRKLPDNLEQLEYLEELYIGSSGLREMPSSLYNLSWLTDLTLIGCTNLLLIGNSIEKLVHLESFRIYNCGMRTLPVARVNVKILDVQNCPLDMEQLLTGVDPGNMSLDISEVQASIGQSAHPNRPGCLTYLIIRHSCILEIDIPRAESLFPKLEILDLSDNRLLTGIGRLPNNLISLKLTNCSNLRRLACLSNLARLNFLDISGCDELETLNVEGLKSIQVIKANGCWKLRSFQGLDLLDQLSCFQISVSGWWMPSSIPRFLIKTIERAGGRVLVLKKYRTEASILIEDVNPSGAIWLFLVTDPNCEIEVSFLGHTYTTHTSTNSKDTVHMLMWRKVSEVFNDIKFSNDDARHFNINVRNSDQFGKFPFRWGWMIEAVYGQVSRDLFNLFVSSFFHRILE